MKCFLILTFFTIALLIQSINCGDETIQQKEVEGAIELNEATFEDFVKSNRLVLIMFYAKFCDHCNKVMPIFNQVNKMLEVPRLTEIPIQLARVNVSKYTALGEKYNVFRFPTLMYFRDNFYVYPYRGSDVSNALGIKVFNSTRANRVILVFSAILTQIKLEAVENWTPPENVVKELSLDNFDEWINSNKLSLVEFYTQKYEFK
jgi:thioredoxin 1